MRCAWVIAVLGMFLAPTAACADKLVVLDLAGQDVKQAYVEYLTSQLRFEALRALPARWVMVSRP